MIKFKNVNAYYDKDRIVKNVDLEIKKGEIYSVIGINGCGKTSLLRCITKNILFDGDIFIDEKNIIDIGRKELARKVGMFSQISKTSFDYNVYETTMMGRFSYNKNNIFFNRESTKEDIESVEKSLCIVGMNDMRDKKLSSLSGGQLQRVFLAKLIAQNPDIILLDEPTNHLDFKYQLEIVEFFKKWSRDENKTILGVFHDVNLAMYLSDNAIVMDCGEIKVKDSITNIIKSGVLNEIYDIDINSFMQNSLSKWNC